MISNKCKAALLIEFEDDIEFEEITGKYRLLILRYKEHKWEKGGIVNVYLNFGQEKNNA